MPNRRTRYCRACGGRLASDNPSSHCGPCGKHAVATMIAPPDVPLEFWDAEPMRAALASWHIGQVIRAYRHHPHHGPRPLPQDLVGDWLGLTQAQVSRVEGGPAVTDLGKLVPWARTLKIPAERLWFKLPGEPPEPGPAPAASHQDKAEGPGPAQQASGGVLLPVVINGHPVLVPLDAATVATSGLGVLLDELAGDGPITPGSSAVSAVEWKVMSPLNRRSLLAHGIVAAALPALGPEESRHVAAALDDARRYLDGPVVGYFRQQLEVCKAHDGALGPRKTLPMVLGVLGAIEQHAREVKPDVRRELLSVGASGAEFAGWLYRDASEPVAAGFWHDRATEWAQEANDTAMQGYVLLKKSQMAYDNRDAVRVLALAQAAQCGPWRLPAKVRAEVAQQEARGLAMIGKPINQVEQKLAEARRLFYQAEASIDTPDELGAYYDEHVLVLRAASCYIEAGQPQRAAALFGGVLATEALSQRDRGYFLARQAASFALSGEPSDASAAGLEAAQVMTAIGSSRTRQELKRTLSSLRPWINRPGPKALREALHARAES